MPGWDLRVRGTRGSSDNLDLLADGKVDLAFAQADVYAQRMSEEPDHFGRLKVVGAFAEECLYVARRASEGPRRLRDLGVAEEGGGYPTISLGATGGGTAESWNHIVTLIPSLANTEIEFTLSTAALGELAAGDVDAAAWITDPENLSHKMLVGVMSNDALTLMDVDDPALAEQLPDGRQVYQVLEVRRSADPSVPKLTTACTEAMVFAGPDASDELLEAVKRALPRLRR